MKRITLFTAICILTYFLEFLGGFIWGFLNIGDSYDYRIFITSPLGTLRLFSIALFFISLYRKQK